jgi:Phage tail tube protein, GTA-gp10
MTAPHNRARGEVLLAIDGRERRLCVTLGALAELEAAFDAVSLAELGERLNQLAASDLITVLAALTAGGGEAIGAAELASARIDPRHAAAAVAEAFRAAFGDEG